jgi:hypothetical protein
MGSRQAFSSDSNPKTIGLDYRLENDPASCRESNRRESAFARGEVLLWKISTKRLTGRLHLTQKSGAAEAGIERPA